jgi:hypothetical protein
MTQTDLKTQHETPAHYDPATMADDREESLVKQYARDFGTSEGVAAENIEWFEEVMATRAPHSDAGATMIEKIWDMFAAIMRMPKAQQWFYFRCFLWRSDYPLSDTLLNNEGPANWCRALYKSKQSAFREANEFCDKLGLPRRSTQRDNAARKLMSVKRLAKKTKG